MTGRSFFLAARSFVGTPWVDKGRSRQGVDCGGLLIVLGKELGLLPQEFDATFDHDRTYDGLHGTLSKFADEIPEEWPAEEGDVWTYSFAGDMHAHCAVYSPSDNSLVHAYPAVQKVAEHSAVGKWVRRVHKRYRVRGLQ